MANSLRCKNDNAHIDNTKKKLSEVELISEIRWKLYKVMNVILKNLNFFHKEPTKEF